MQNSVPGDFVIRIRSLSRRFRDKLALDNVSLDVPRGAVFGLVGENGAGKTTLLKHMLGLFKGPPESVRVLGMDPVADPAAVLSRVGYLSENRELPDWMRIREYMHFQASFYPDWDHDYAATLLRMFELNSDQKIRSLSRGQVARVGLLAAIAHRPELLILDEPSSGLDPVVRRDILAAIIRTVADEGRTVLFSSHLLDEVQRVSDHVAMLHHGRLLLSDRLETVLEQHSGWTIRLSAPLTHVPDIPGTISCDGSGQEFSVICNGRQAEMHAWIAQHKAEIVSQTSPGLEEIFVATTGSPGRHGRGDAD